MVEKSGTTYEGFHASITFGFKLEKLKALIVKPKLQEYFIERKIFLDRVVISRIIVDNQELAQELHTQIEEGASFEYLAREYSITDDRMVNGMMGAISRGKMPDALRAKVDIATTSCKMCFVAYIRKKKIQCFFLEVHVFYTLSEI